MARGKEFASLVYQICVVEKRHSLERLAECIGLTYHNLHARVINRVSFSADEIRALIAVIADPRLVAYLLRGTRFVAADRTSADGRDLPDAIHRGAARIVIEAADVLEAVEIGLGDGKIDHKDGLVILKEIEIAERALASLRLTLQKIS